MSPSYPGTVITFYSFKGGVGRTFALADVAVYLATWGWRVLCVDWDLEAPGLDGYLPTPPNPPHPSIGVLDFLVALASDQLLPPTEIPVDIDLCEGRLHFIRAGSEANYGARLAEVNWSALYEDHALITALERLRADWTLRYDFVLIDSRTGYSEYGATAAILLPDILVALTTTSRQSLDGTTHIVDTLPSRQALLPLERPQLRIVPVVTRVPWRLDSEAERRVKNFQRAMVPVIDRWDPETPTPEAILAAIQVPEIPAYVGAEELPAVVEMDMTPGTAAYAHANLAAILARRLFDGQALIANRAEVVPALPSDHPFYSARFRGTVALTLISGKGTSHDRAALLTGFRLCGMGASRDNTASYDGEPDHLRAIDTRKNYLSVVVFDHRADRVERRFIDHWINHEEPAPDLFIHLIGPDGDISELGLPSTHRTLPVKKGSPQDVVRAVVQQIHEAGLGGD